VIFDIELLRSKQVAFGFDLRTWTLSFLES